MRAGPAYNGSAGQSAYERIEVDWRDRCLVVVEGVVSHALLEVIPEDRPIERPEAQEVMRPFCMASKGKQFYGSNGPNGTRPALRVAGTHHYCMASTGKGRQCRTALPARRRTAVGM